jgi:hypothetical protein
MKKLPHRPPVPLFAFARSGGVPLEKMQNWTTPVWPKTAKYIGVSGVATRPKGKMGPPELPRLNARSSLKQRHSYGSWPARHFLHAFCLKVGPRDQMPDRRPRSQNASKSMIWGDYEDFGIAGAPSTKCPIGMKIHAPPPGSPEK